MIRLLNHFRLYSNVDYQPSTPVLVTRVDAQGQISTKQLGTNPNLSKFHVILDIDGTLVQTVAQHEGMIFGEPDYEDFDLRIFLHIFFRTFIFLIFFDSIKTCAHTSALDWINLSTFVSPTFNQYHYGQLEHKNTRSSLPEVSPRKGFNSCLC
jgi:hypothetical protein